MVEASRSLPLILVAVATTAFILLALYTHQEPAAETRGDPVAILLLQDVGPGDTCAPLAFTVDRTYDNLSLSYRFGTAIKPRISVTLPDGSEREARATGGELDLSIPDPPRGNWSLQVWVEASPGLRTGIDDGQVYLLAFPETTGGGSRPSICRGTLSES